MIDMLFYKNRANDRKNWVSNYDREAYLNTTKDNFKKTIDISCYSFTAIAREASKMMNNGGSLLTLSYFGSEKFMPHYNVTVSYTHLTLPTILIL